MRLPTLRRRHLLAGALLPVSAPAASAAPMRRAALALQAGVGAERRAQLCLPFASPERHRWSYLPGRRRAGVMIGTMPEAERALVFALLATALSERGYAKAAGVLRLADVLRRTRSFGGEGSGIYAIALFGDPAADGPWGFRFEGHHLSLNHTFLGDELVSATPHCVCADPMWVRGGPEDGLAPLDREDYMGRALALSLEAGQLARARLPGRAPTNIMAGPGQPPPGPEGIASAQLTDETQTHLILGLAETYLANLPPAHARAAMARLQAGARDGLHFAWMGGLEEADEHYYRLRGPSLLIEYSTRNRPDHVHTVWREPGQDFGRAALERAGIGPLPPAEA